MHKRTAILAAYEQKISTSYRYQINGRHFQMSKTKLEVVSSISEVGCTSRYVPTNWFIRKSYFYVPFESEDEKNVLTCSTTLANSRFNSEESIIAQAPKRGDRNLFFFDDFPTSSHTKIEFSFVFSVVFPTLATVVFIFSVLKHQKAWDECLKT